MFAVPRSRRAFVHAPAPALLTGALLSGLAGCGGSAPSDAASVKAHLVVVADALDACVAKHGDARKCVDTDALGSLPGGVELGDGDGQIEIDASRPTRYQLTAKADGGARYAVLAQPVGARKRVCTPAGSSACGKDGRW